MRKTSALIDDPKVARVITPILSCGVMQNRSDDCPPHSTLHQRTRERTAHLVGGYKGLGGARSLTWWTTLPATLLRMLTHWRRFAEPEHRWVEGIRCVQGSVVSTSLTWKTYLKQIYALLICISNSNSNEKACVLTARHAPRINTQFILSKWITYLICAGAVIIISLAHKYYTHSLPVNKAYEIPFCQLALWEMIQKEKKINK